MFLDILMSKDAAPLLVRTSVQKDLHRLFNTREGSLRHLPDYGLPDIHKIYDSFPHGIQNFIQTIQEKISKYEPRLKEVEVKNINQQNKKFCVLSLVKYTENIHQGKAWFDGDFYSAGYVNINLKN